MGERDANGALAAAAAAIGQDGFADRFLAVLRAVATDLDV